MLALIAWPPLSLVRFVTLASSDWILTDYRAEGGARATFRKLIAVWLSTGYASKLARVDDLCGDERQADHLYRLVANNVSAGADYRAAELRLAARHFVAFRAGAVAANRH